MNFANFRVKLSWKVIRIGERIYTPDLGYYSVTPFLRKQLVLSEQSMRDFICSEHFAETCFDNQGRLVSGSVPTFFPQRSSKDHDHSYSGCANTLGDSIVDDEGRVDK